MFKLVETVRTKFSQLDLCKALITVWYEEYGSLPSKESIGVLVSQNRIETGKDYCWNFNIGNSKVGSDVDGKIIEYMTLRNVWEIENGKKVIYQPPHRATWFRSFTSLTDGVRHHFDLLKNKRYRVAWSAIEKGNVTEFARLLKKQGYYTAPESAYAKGMMAHYNVYSKSNNYEKAMEEFNSTFVSPPLQPWVDLDLSPAPMEDLEVNDYEDAKDVSQEYINNRSQGIALTLKNFLDTVFLWLKPKS